jgi:hypothetical protein
MSVMAMRLSSRRQFPVNVHYRIWKDQLSKIRSPTDAL